MQPPDFYAVRFSDFITQNVFRKGPEPPAESISIPLVPARVTSVTSPLRPEPVQADPRDSLDNEMHTSLYPTERDELQEVELTSDRSLPLVTRPSVRFRDPATVGTETGATGSSSAGATLTSS